MTIFLGKTIENKNSGNQFYIYKTNMYPYTDGCPDYGHHQYKYINYYVDETGTFGRREFILPMRGNVEYLLSENTNYRFAKQQKICLQHKLNYWKRNYPHITAPLDVKKNSNSLWNRQWDLYDYLNQKPNNFRF